jgi:hypothetical protein
MEPSDASSAGSLYLGRFRRCYSHGLPALSTGAGTVTFRPASRPLRAGRRPCDRVLTARTRVRAWAGALVRDSNLVDRSSFSCGCWRAGPDVRRIHPRGRASFPDRCPAPLPGRQAEPVAPFQPRVPPTARLAATPRPRAAIGAGRAAFGGTFGTILSVRR